MTLFPMPEEKVREKQPKNRKLKCDVCSRPTWLGGLCVSLGRAVCCDGDSPCLGLPAYVVPRYPDDDPNGEFTLTKNAHKVLEYERAQ